MAVPNNQVTMNTFVQMVEDEYRGMLEDLQKGSPSKMASYLIVGPTGIGKTEQVYQLAERLAKLENLPLVTRYDLPKNPDLLKDVLDSKDKYFLLAQFDLITDVLSIPYVTNKEDDEIFTYAYPAALKALTKHPGILLLEEVRNVQRDDDIIIWKKMLGELKFHDKVVIIGASNQTENASIVRSLPPPLLSRTQIFEILPPTPEEWLSYMIKKYRDYIPKDILGFLSGFTEEINKLDLDELNDLPDSKKLITTPRGLESLIQQYIVCDIANLNFKDREKATYRLNALSGIIDPNHFIQFATYLEERSNIVRLLDDKNKVDKSTQIAALVYMGDVLGSIAKVSDKEKLGMVTNNLLISLEKFPHYINQLGQNKEMLNFLFLGAGAFDKNTPIQDMFKITACIASFADGKINSFEDLQKLHEKINKDFKFSLDELFANQNSKKIMEDLLNKLDSYATTDRGRAIINKFNLLGGDIIIQTID